MTSYQSSYGMELLASVHWVATREPGVESIDGTIPVVHAWNDRKRQLMQPRHIAAAFQRLVDEGWLTFARRWRLRSTMGAHPTVARKRYAKAAGTGRAQNGHRMGTKQNADHRAGAQLSLSYCFCSRILGCEGRMVMRSRQLLVAGRHGEALFDVIRLQSFTNPLIHREIFELPSVAALVF